VATDPTTRWARPRRPSPRPSLGRPESPRANRKACRPRPRRCVQHDRLGPRVWRGVPHRTRHRPRGEEPAAHPADATVSYGAEKTALQTTAPVTRATRRPPGPIAPRHGKPARRPPPPGPTPTWGPTPGHAAHRPASPACGAARRHRLARPHGTTTTAPDGQASELGPHDRASGTLPSGPRGRYRRRTAPSTNRT